MLIEDEAANYTVTRFLPGYTVNGKLIKGSSTTLIIFASIQPLQPREMLILPEGERTRERIRVYTETMLTTADESSQSMGDRVTYKGRDYEVQQRELWDDGEEPYYKAIAVLVEQDQREVDMDKIVISTYQVIVGKTSSKILDINTRRNLLRIENKDSENAAVIKVGVDFVTPAAEVQNITFSEVPTAGTWQIAVNGGLTQEMAYNADNSAVQAQLRTMELCSLVVVTGNYTTGFIVTWDTNTDQELMVVSSIGLVTSAHEAYAVQHIAFSAVPDAGSWKIKQGSLETASLAFDADATAISTALSTAGINAVASGDYSSGFDLTFSVYAVEILITISANTLTNSDNIQDDVQAIYAAQFSPDAGTFQLQFGGYTTTELDPTSGTLPAQMEAALEALASIGSGNVTCDWMDRDHNLVKGISIDFTGVPGAQALITVWDNTCTYLGTDILLQIQSLQVGIGPEAVAATVSETTAGVGNIAVTIAVAETTTGVPDLNEGFALPAGAVPGNPIEFAMSVPIEAIYARAEDDGVILEVSEG